MNEHATHTRDALNKAATIVLATHRNPDGDAMGSVLGLQNILLTAGKQVTVFLPTPCPTNLLWMPGAADAKVWQDVPEHVHQLSEADTVVVLDLNDLDRLGELGKAIANTSAVIVNIDHHTHPQDFAHVQWIDTEAPSVCSMLADLYADQQLSPEAAMCLYCGVMTDTGSFRFPRTTAATFLQASRLVEQGADPVAAYERIMNTNSFNRETLLGSSLRGMKLFHSGQLCVMTVSQADLSATGTTVEDTEGFVHHTLSINGVRMGVLLIELPGEIKCSFRSKGSVFVRDLAAKYNGGGHVYAAGARIPDLGLDQAVAEVVANSFSALQQAPSQ